MGLAAIVGTIGDLVMTEDIVVLSGLAVLFGWTYVILPLVFYHG